MNPYAEKPLRDAIDVCDEAALVTAGRVFSDYLPDVLLRRGIERIVQLVGELLSRALQHQPDRIERIPTVRNAIGMRHRIAHGYKEIRDEVVWDAATVRMPKLRDDVLRLVNNEADAQ